MGNGPLRSETGQSRRGNDDPLRQKVLVGVSVGCFMEVFVRKYPAHKNKIAWRTLRILFNFFGSGAGKGEEASEQVGGGWVFLLKIEEMGGVYLTRRGALPLKYPHLKREFYGHAGSSAERAPKIPGAREIGAAISSANNFCGHGFFF